MSPVPVEYPQSPAARSRWIVEARPSGARATDLDPRRPSAWLVEEELGSDGVVRPGLTLFLVNRECPWRCAMCDLWKHTLPGPVGPGDVPAQMDVGLATVVGRRTEWIKLYNAGSFFDGGAIPITDHQAIADRCRGFARVIVECHPKLVGPSVLRFRDMLPPGTVLEVAMGLETAHPVVLERLNKRMTPADFARAAGFLRSNGCSVRTFLLTRPPFLDAAEVPDWLARSIRFAFDAGADPVVLIPTRLGNGAMERLVAAGEFALPGLEVLESAMAYGLSLGRGRILADLWDLERVVTPSDRLAARRERLEHANRTQQWRGD